MKPSARLTTSLGQLLADNFFRSEKKDPCRTTGKLLRQNAWFIKSFTIVTFRSLGIVGFD